MFQRYLAWRRRMQVRIWRFTHRQEYIKQRSAEALRRAEEWRG